MLASIFRPMGYRRILNARGTSAGGLSFAKPAASTRINALTRSRWRTARCHAAAHGISRHRKSRQLQLRRESIDKVRQALAAQGHALRGARQPVPGEIQTD